MTINVLADDVISVAEAADLLRSSASTLVRFITVGRPGPDGKMVRLAAVKVGARWVTTRAAICEFVNLTTPTFEREHASA